VYPTDVSQIPGQHLVIIGQELDALRWRARGLVLRDSLVIALPGPTSLIAFLFRVPLAESVITGNILTHGQGAICIDACRIPTNSADAQAMTRCNTPGSHRMMASKSPIGTFTRSSGSGALDTAKGRWPTNLLLVHGPGCRHVGTRSIKGISGGEHIVRRSGAHAAAKGHQTIGRIQPPRKGHANADGTETVTAWECQPDCPVRLLDEMGGALKSGTGNNIPSLGKHVAYDGFDRKAFRTNDRVTRDYNDSGTASRFYPQFPDLHTAVEWLGLLVGEAQAA